MIYMRLSYTFFSKQLKLLKETETTLRNLLSQIWHPHKWMFMKKINTVLTFFPFFLLKNRLSYCEHQLTLALILDLISWNSLLNN